jgi:two-component system, NtrC family, sensor histidine kinase HydH
VEKQPTEPRVLPRVLIVEDNEAYSENLQEVLEASGYRARLAASCAEATRAASDGFELALVDLRLPDGDGTELAAQLKASSPELEVVVLTGFATVETAAAAVRAGAFAYLVKPCGTDQLLLTLEQAMRHQRLGAEKREMARRVQVNEKLAAVGTLTAGLSHEIRNPLNAAGLQLEILERRVRKLADEVRPPLLEPLLLVREEIRRLEHLLEDFLQFARPRELRAQPVDLVQLFGRVLDLLAEEADRRGVVVERYLAPATASGDRDRLQQVLMNLCLNGIEAMPKGGRLLARTAPGNRETVVVIEDSGPGIPAEAQPHIFEPFFTTKAKGTGLGLPIVHAIVQQHGGSISVGDREGGGTRFEVRLPTA